jgi:Xaa-Pro aminopeptidase
VAALVEGLSAARLDGLLLTSLPNIRYLTGFSGSSALTLVTARQTILITDFRYQTQVGEEVGDIAEARIEPQSLWSGLWRVLPQLPNAELMGFESAHLLHRDFERLLEAGARWQWRPTVDLVEALRERKDAAEVALITEAGGVATRALERTAPTTRA